MDFTRPPNARDLAALLPGARVVDLVRVPSLYVITRGHVVEYVGKTDNWLQRLERHQRGVVGPPSLTPERMMEAIIVPCRMSRTLRERALIAWLRPPPEHQAPVLMNERFEGILDNWLNK